MESGPRMLSVNYSNYVMRSICTKFLTPFVALGCLSLPAAGVSQVSSATGVGVCQVPTDTLGVTLWNDVRSMLQSMQKATQQQQFNHTVRLHRRLLTPQKRVFSETDSVARDLSVLPVPSAHPDQVLDAGFVARGPDGEWSYFAPGPSTLLDEDFLHSYCVFKDPTGGNTLSFAPRDAGSAGAIAGTILIDEESHAPRRIDFKYLNNPAGAIDSMAGGTLRFAQIPSGPWIMKEWNVRIPILNSGDDETDSALQYIALEEMGAAAVEIRDGSDDVIWSDDSIAVLSGTVRDSTSGAPIEGALVALAGTRHWATTDQRGEYFLAGRFDGLYSLVYGHPRLDSLGFVSVPQPVELRPGDTRAVSAAVPPVSTILRRRCGDDAASNGRRTLLGVVQDGQTGRVVPGALVNVSRTLIPEGLQEFASDRVSNTVRTDSLGMYTLCDVPVGETIIVNAVIDNRSSAFTEVTFTPGAVQFDRRQLLLLAYPVARFDLELHGTEAFGSIVSGVVVDDATGEGLPDVEVQIDGTLRVTTTGPDGSFQFAGVPQGSVWFAFRKLGYRMLRHRSSVGLQASVNLSADELRMRRASAEAIELDPIVVEAESAVPTATGFDDRRRRGFGSFMARDEFEDWNPSVPTDIMRRMRGVRVLPNPLYGVNGDTRRYQIVPSRDIGQRITRLTRDRDDLADGVIAGAVTECPVLLFLDGVYLGDSGTTDVDNMVGMSALAAIEFYSPSQVPPRFALPGSTCGVAVFWSR